MIIFFPLLIALLRYIIVILLYNNENITNYIHSEYDKKQLHLNNLRQSDVFKNH